jgi:aspartokinase
MEKVSPRSPVLVMKFGGTSVRDVADVLRLVQ